MEKILALPPAVRHLVMIGLAMFLQWLGTDVLDILAQDSTLMGAVAFAVLTALLSVFTPLVTSYGVGARAAKRLGARDPSDVVAH